MSYQFPPTGDPNAPFGGSPPTVQQSAVPFSPNSAPVGRRSGLIAAGALVLAAGVAAGVVMFAASGKNYDEGVQNLARAPLGCTTSLAFDKTGTFTVYIETSGSIGEVRGDCPGTDSDFEFSGDALPNVDIVLTDGGGDQVDLDDDFSKDYDAGGSVGQSIASVNIEKAGDYDITVTSNDDDFAVAIGKNPKKSADSLRTNGLVAFVAGVVLGGAMLILGLRRRTPRVPPAVPYAGMPPSQSSQYGAAPGAYAAGPAGPAPPAVGWPPAPAPPPPGPPMGPTSWPAPPTG
jgi:hypothetical protein